VENWVLPETGQGYADYRSSVPMGGEFSPDLSPDRLTKKPMVGI
jgi:hypothetical protein